MPTSRKHGTKRNPSDQPAPGERWELLLYIAGRSPTTEKTIEDLEAVFLEELRGSYSLKVIDLEEQPQMAADHQILAVPTLVRTLPKPIRKVTGDLSSRRVVLVGLGLRPLEE